MDLKMDWEKTRELVPDILLKFLQAMVPHFGLYLDENERLYRQSQGCSRGRCYFLVLVT